MSEQLNGIQAAEQAGPGGRVAILSFDGERVEYEIGSDGQPMDKSGEPILASSEYWASEFEVIRVGPEKVEVEPYEGEFELAFDQGGESFVHAKGRGGGVVANNTSESLLRVVAARLNETMRVAKSDGDAVGYSRGKAKWIAEEIARVGWAARARRAEEENKQLRERLEELKVMTPAVVKLVAELRRLSPFATHEDAVAAWQAVLQFYELDPDECEGGKGPLWCPKCAATQPEPERKTCPGCHGQDPCIGSYCSTCNGERTVPVEPERKTCDSCGRPYGSDGLCGPCGLQDDLSNQNE